MEKKMNKLATLFVLALLFQAGIINAVSIGHVAVNPSHTSAGITWDTDLPSDSKVSYGTEISLENEIKEDEQVTSHSLQLTNLEPETQYFYKVESCDNNECDEGTVETFVTTSSDAPKISVELPDFHNSEKLTIKGTTAPNSKVRVFVDDNLRRALESDNGIFEFIDVRLDVSKEKNTVKIVTIDSENVQNSFEKTITIDTSPPILNVSEIPRFSHEQSITLTGSVNEQVTFEVDVGVGDGAPKQVEGLSIVRQEDNSVELSWQEIEGIEGYIIYKNGKRLTTFADTSFIDPTLNKNAQYIYEVSAYSTSCVEGEKSTGIQVTTTDQGRELDDEFTELEQFCQGQALLKKVSGSFSERVDLNDGKNVVTVRVTDRAGNVVEKVQETILDTEPPVIMEHNLDSISPSYVTDVTLKGRVQKKEGQVVFVVATVNGEEYSTLAEEDGTFALEVNLERKVRLDLDAEFDYDPEDRRANLVGTYGNEHGVGWGNELTLFARAESGLESDPITQGVVLATCGYGSWWSIDLGKATPEILTPRLMLEGFAQIGIPVNSIKWQGGSRNATLTGVDVTVSRQISDEDARKYDSDWVDVQYIKSDDLNKGYVLVSVKKLDTLFDQDLTTLAMENNLTEHRDDCLLPGFGCIRVPLVMELDFAYNEDNRNPSFRGNVGEIDQTVQRQCWEVEIPIDKRLPSDKIPESFLETSINFLNETINVIDDILGPLNAVKEVLFYSCAGSILIDFSMAFSESFACEFSSTLSKLGEDKWELYHAQTGQCDAFYDGEARSSCQSCSDAIQSRRDFQGTMRLVCDRIFCPTAPSFQKYVSDQSEKYRISADDARGKEVVSDCAYGHTPGQKTTLRYDQIKTIYDEYQETKDSPDNECGSLHEPNNNCCAYEYVEQWDSTCLLMDELKESKCAAYQDLPPGAAPDPDCSAGRHLWNSLAGFCEADGSPPPETINVQDTFGGKDKKVQSSFVAQDYRQNAVWFRLVPRDKLFTAADAKKTVYHAEIGTMTSDVKIAEKDWKPGEPSKVATSTAFKPVDGRLWKIDTTTLDERSKDFDAQAKERFIDDYVAYTGSPRSKAKSVYESIQRTIGVGEQENIVDPTSGLLRSVQCACLPGVTSYLSLWQKVLDAIKLCFETVLKTGDGNAGICKAVLSTYVCDLVYELISCFTDKYSSNGVRQFDTGIGNFFGALTSAGGKVSSQVQNRYGGSSMYRAIFAEQKLVHSACLWAFTGTWDFDVTAVLEEDVTIDVETVGVSFPCTRRFVSFNPTSNPSGLTTYNYHVGVGLVAGSKLSYSVDLICSSDYSCDDGQCDCVGIGEQRLSIPIGPGTADRGQTINEEYIQNIQNAPYRYDTVLVKWNSEDSSKSGQTECSINEIGGTPPAFCSLDIAEGAFRCELGFEQEEYIRFLEKPAVKEREYYPRDSGLSQDLDGEDRSIIVSMKAAQKQPKEDVERYAGKDINPYTKFLVMELFNSQGQKVEESPAYPFNGNGVHEPNNLPGFTFSKDDFTLSPAKITTRKGPVASIELLQGKVPSIHEVVLVRKDTNAYDVYDFILDRGKKTRRPQPSQTPQVVGDREIFFDNYKIRLARPTRQGEEIHVVFTEENSRGQCTDRLEKWKLHVTFYDKKEGSDERSTQISVYQGQQQQEIVDVPVRCIEPGRQLCPPGKITTQCICGDTLCKVEAGKTLYCNYSGDGSSGTCEEQEKFLPSILKLEYEDPGRKVVDPSKPIKFANQDMTIHLSAEDKDGEVKEVRVEVTHSDFESSDVHDMTGDEVEFEIFLFDGKNLVEIWVVDNEGRESKKVTFEVEKQ